MLTEGFFAMTQQFPRHVFSGVTPRHFAKFDHLGTTILVATNWFCDSSKNLQLLFLFSLDLAAEYFLLYKAFLEYIADWEYLPTPLTRTGFQRHFLTFLTLPPESAFFVSGFSSFVSASQLFHLPSFKMGKSYLWSF